MNRLTVLSLPFRLVFPGQFYSKDDRKNILRIFLNIKHEYDCSCQNRRYVTQHKDTQQNDIQHNDTQHNGKKMRHLA